MNNIPNTNRIPVDKWQPQPDEVVINCKPGIFVAPIGAALNLDIDDKISNFNCGDEDINDFILHESQLYRGELLAVSYVIEDNNGAVLAYFSLANDKISIT